MASFVTCCRFDREANGTKSHIAVNIMSTTRHDRNTGWATHAMPDPRSHSAADESSSSLGSTAALVGDGQDEPVKGACRLQRQTNREFAL